MQTQMTGACKTLFIQGKGGTGKTTISKALFQKLSKKHKTLWVTDAETEKNDHVLNFSLISAFKEYVRLKLRWTPGLDLVTGSRPIQSLVQIAPGLKEMIFLGKIWYETRNYDYIVVDMPSTGHGLAVFHSFFRWKKLFENSPLSADHSQIEEWILNSPNVHHAITTLPEEMPLTEAWELRQKLGALFRGVEISLILNKLFPAPPTDLQQAILPEDSLGEYWIQKYQTEQERLESFREQLQPDQWRQILKIQHFGNKKQLAEGDLREFTF